MSEVDELLNEVEGTKKVKNCPPVVRKAAEENDIDLTTIRGTGKNGAIKIVDFERDTGIILSKNQGSRDRVEDPRVPTHKLVGEKSQEVGGMKFTRNSRSDFDHSSRLKLDIPQRLKNNDLYYRWFDADPTRINHASENGYQKVDPSHFPDDERIAVERVVGTKRDGVAHKQVLMATPKTWVEERNRLKEKHRREIEGGMMKNPQDERGELGSEYYNAQKAAQKRI